MPKSSAQAVLRQLVTENEEWLMKRILGYAAEHDYTRYTSTLQEAWRASISGLSDSILGALETYQDIPEFGPDEEWFADVCGQFGRFEAGRHRDRGITLAMFLALMKYYRQCYLDLLNLNPQPGIDLQWCTLFLQRVFDRIEISFITVWEKYEETKLIKDLQQKNRILTNEKNKYLTMFESYSLPCLFVDKSGNLDSMNLPAAKLFGSANSPGEHYYRSEKTMQIPGELAAELAQFIAGETAEYEFERQISTADERIDYLIMFKRMLDVSNKFSGVIVSMMNISVQKELEKTHTNLKMAQSQLLQQEKMASIGQLAAGVAHEINNPIGFISSNLNCLNRYMEKLTSALARGKEQLDQHAESPTEQSLAAILGDRKLNQIIEDIPDLIEESLDGAERVSNIVQNLKTFSRVDSQQCSSCDLNESLESALNIVWNELKYKVKVTKDYGDLPQLKCYPQQLSQVFLNLLVNAGHAIESEGEIRLKTWQDKDWLCISISDTGCGMSEETQRRIFEPFFTTKPVGQGTGLGMSIVYDVIQQHRGTIDIESSPGQGSRLTIRLPLGGVQEENGKKMG